MVVKLGKRAPVMTTTAQLADKLMLVAEAEECRDSLKTFVQCAWKSVDPSPFTDGYCLDAMCDHLTALTTGQIRFLLINIPPRHGKSTVCSVLWPIWSWLHHPEEKFLCASYSLNLAIRDNVKKRTLIQSKWFQDRYGQSFKLMSPTQSVRFLREKEFELKQNARRFFANDKMGYQLAVSVGSTTTGEGGSVLSIDDAHSATEAYSVIERESALTWFREVWSNRMNDAAKDRMLVIGQRIHDQDISGLILKERPDWVHLDLPAEYEEARHCHTVIGWSDWRKEPGDLLWPERFSQETLERYKRDLGSMGYAAQYQQSPIPATGGQFKKTWFRYFTETEEAYILEKPEGTRAILKSACWQFGTIDLAISSRQSADYTVFAVWAVTPERDLILLKVIREHLGNPEQLKQLRLLAMHYPGAYWKIERVGYQLALIQQALAEGILCREYNPIKDKVSRASTAAIWLENGKVFFRTEADWLHDLESELLLFPRAAHDDQVDVLSMASDEITLHAREIPVAVSDGNRPEVLTPAYQATEDIVMQRRQEQLARIFTSLSNPFG